VAGRSSGSCHLGGRALHRRGLLARVLLVPAGVAVGGAGAGAGAAKHHTASNPLSSWPTIRSIRARDFSVNSTSTATRRPPSARTTASGRCARSAGAPGSGRADSSRSHTHTARGRRCATGSRTSLTAAMCANAPAFGSHGLQLPHATRDRHA